jgi:hypothetical protein
MTAQVILDKDVPAAVKNNMKEKFAGYTALAWKQDVPGFISADFVLNKVKMNATFNTNGGWVSTLIYFKKEEFPSQIVAFVSSNYAGAKIISCAKSESVKEKTHELRIKYNEELYDLVLNEDYSLKLKSKVE